MIKQNILHPKKCQHDNLRPNIFVNNKDEMEEATKWIEVRSKSYQNFIKPARQNKNFKEAYRVFKAVHKLAVVVLIKNSSFYLNSISLKVTSLHGNIEIFGFLLKEGKCINLSTNYDGAYKCKTVPSESNNTLKTTLDQLLSEDDHTTFFKCYKDTDVVLLLEYSELPSYVHIKDFVPELQQNMSTKRLETVNLGLQFSIEINPERSIDVSSDWQTVDLISPVVIAGGKGVGKSTLLKYFLNSWLNRYDNVLVMDLDPGQPEFSTPGTLSLILIDHPIFGPNFTHVRHFLRSVHIGFVDIGSCCVDYCKALDDLVTFAKAEYSHLPLIVNTSGFCDGLGVNIITRIIHTIKPKTVVQINGEMMTRNFPFDLTVENVQDFNLSNVLGGVSSTLSYKLHKLKSISGSASMQIKSKKLREIMILAYFSQILTAPEYNFTTVVPFRLSFKDLYIGVKATISPNDILKVLNGVIVSLENLECPTNIVQTGDDSWFKISLKPKLSQSFGLGIVRAIDVEKKELYIITPIPQKHMRQVNMLVISEIGVPPSIYLKQDSVIWCLPYTVMNKNDHTLGIERQYQSPRI